MRLASHGVGGTGNGLNPEILPSQPRLSKWRLPPALTRITKALVSLGRPSRWTKPPPKALAHQGADPEVKGGLPGCTSEGRSSPRRQATSSHGLDGSSEPRKSSLRRKPLHALHRLKNGILAPEKRILPHTTQESYKVQTCLLSFKKKKVSEAY